MHGFDARCITDVSMHGVSRMRCTASTHGFLCPRRCLPRPRRPPLQRDCGATSTRRRHEAPLRRGCATRADQPLVANLVRDTPCIDTVQARQTPCITGTCVHREMHRRMHRENPASAAAAVLRVWRDARRRLIGRHCWPAQTRRTRQTRRTDSPDSTDSRPRALSTRDAKSVFSSSRAHSKQSPCPAMPSWPPRVAVVTLDVICHWHPPLADIYWS